MVFGIAEYDLISLAVGLFFFWGGFSGYRSKKLQGFREANTISGGEVSEGEAFGAKVIGGFLMAFGLFIIVMVLHNVFLI